MNAFTHLCRSAAVALLAGLLACAGVVPAMAATPKDLTITLPTEPVLATPIAVSGKNVLVESNGAFRLSRDNGKHWVKANVPFSCGGSCNNQRSSIGDVSGGVVMVQGSTLEAYSLSANAAVGTPYPVPGKYFVVHMLGALALLHNFDTGRATVRSLITGATHDVDLPSGFTFFRLLADGSVLARSTDDASSAWIRISPSGITTSVLSASWHMNRVTAASGNLLLFGGDQGKYCLVTLPNTTPSCGGLGRGQEPLAMSSTGVLLGTERQATWHPFIGGKIGRSIASVKLDADAYAAVVSFENGYPAIAQRNTTSSWLKRFTSGKIITVPLGWARQPVDVTSLALTPTAVVGSSFGSDQRNFYAWWRSAERKVGGQHRLSTDGTTYMTASGGRWATSVEWESLHLFDRTRQTTLIAGPYSDIVVRQSGPYLLAYPECNPGEGDPNPPCRPRRILDPTGGTLVKETAARDIFGTLAVEATTTDGKLTVRDFIEPKTPPVVVTLPDPGPEGSYRDVTIWGDWVAATKTSGQWWSEVSVAHNYRTGITLTAPGNTALADLGDGFALVNDNKSTQLKVWNFADGTLRILAAGGTRRTNPVATDGSRVAFVKGGSIAIKTIANAGKSAPRVLGVVAPTALKGTWKADIDLTKAVGSGRLEIRDSTGKLVRWLTVKATKDGSLRGITWNGRNQAGKRVVAGSYTYLLTNRASDGTGAVRLIDGAKGPIGTIQVP